LWGLNAEDRDNEIVVRAEVPGFEAAALVKNRFDGNSSLPRGRRADRL
jgi:HSP20 family molecular chaperone IbpA